MNVGSLFSGIGGLDAGLARAGFRHAFLCESDPWRRDILAARFPGVPIYEDVRDVVGGVPDAQRAGGVQAGMEGSAVQPTSRECSELPRDVDLIAGGFPCQDVSVAGRRAGLAGSRSGLFHEFARIAESLRPRWLLVENVPGLLSSNGGRDFGVVLGTLADLGYGLAWRIVDSRYFGVPQRRRRVFILGALAGRDPRAAAERCGEILAVGSRCKRHPATRGEAGQDVAVASANGAGDGRPHYYVEDFEDGTLTSSTGRIDRHPLTVAAPLEATDDLVSIPLAASNANGTGHAPDERQYVVQSGVRRLTPIECERLQSLPDNWTAPTGSEPDSRRYAALGDAVTASVGEWIGRRIVAA